MAESAAGGDLPDRIPGRADACEMRDGRAVQNRAVYLAIGVNLEGDKDVLGPVVPRNEGAKFWLQVLTEMKTARRAGCPPLLRRRVERLPGGDRGDLPEATVQTCIVHYADIAVMPTSCTESFVEGLLDSARSA